MQVKHENGKVILKHIDARLPTTVTDGETSYLQVGLTIDEAEQLLIENRLFRCINEAKSFKAEDKKRKIDELRLQIKQLEAESNPISVPGPKKEIK